MLIKAEIPMDYNPFENTYNSSKSVLVDVPDKKIANLMAKQFGVDKEKMYDILMDIYDYMDFDDYFEDNEEIQNLAQEYYNYECEEDD